MRDRMTKHSVDLIYLDPPFNSNRNYNTIYKDETGRPLPDQIEAFCDTWTLTQERESAIRNMPITMRASGIDDGIVEFWQMWVKALRKTQPNLLAYLSYMVERLIHMRILLKPTGSIYLHCDTTASHYLKALMDAIFGHKCFQNEIIWSYRRWPSKSKKYQTMHDVILYYVRSPSLNHTFNVAYEEPSESYKKRFGGKTQVLDPETKSRKLIIDEPTKGMPQRDVWEMPILAGSSKERLKFSTQKPLKLLDRIIRTSSNKGDVVFDPFCGCATTLEAAERLERKWIGVDIAIHAVKRVASVRLRDRLGLVENKDFEIEGVPRNIEGARDLHKRDPYHFQKWAVEQVEGFVTTKRTSDGGIDGRIYFEVPRNPELQSMVLEVKGGENIGIDDVHKLRSVLEDDSAQLAGLITMDPVSGRKKTNFEVKMAEAGVFEVNGIEYPRMQMLSVEEILSAKRFRTPGVMGRRVQYQPVLPGTLPH